MCVCVGGCVHVHACLRSSVCVSSIKILAGLFPRHFSCAVQFDSPSCISRKLSADADDIQGSISQEIKPWVCCAPQGDMIYDPSWHHPPPLIPHYSKMVFETGQFDDAED